MRNYPVTILNAADTSTQTGSAFFVGQSVAASFTNLFGDATAAGTLTIQGSNDIPVGNPNQYTPNANSWNVITSASSTIASGVGPAIILQTMNFQYIRAVYTRSSGGSSTVLVNMTALGLS